jgi:hypothetical protein
MCAPELLAAAAVQAPLVSWLVVLWMAGAFRGPDAGSHPDAGIADHESHDTPRPVTVTA